MAIDIRTAIWTAEISVWDNFAAALTTLKVATSANFLVNGSSPASAGFLMILDQPAIAARSAFGGNATMGGGQASSGRIILRMDSGRYDHLREYSFDGREIIFKIVAPGAEWTTTYQNSGNFTTEGASIGLDTIELSLRDWQTALDIPLQQTLYLGTGGLEGDASLKGKPKPVMLGRLGANRLVEPIEVDPIKRIYHVHHGLLSAINAVYDGALPLTTGATSWSQQQPAGVAVNSFFDGIDHDGAGIMMACGKAGIIYKSTDYGANWSALTSGVGVDLHCIKWFAAASLWICAGDTGTLITSPDGTTWTSRTSQFSTTNIRAIDCNASLAVIVGDAVKMSSSTDGTTWTSRTSSFTSSANINAITRRMIGSVERWVIVGAQVAYSDNGTTWTRSNDGAYTSLGLTFRCVKGGPLNYVAGGNGGLCCTSVDGIQWTNVSLAQGATSFSTAHLIGMGQNNGLFICSAAASFGSLLGISNDGVVWKMGNDQSIFCNAFVYNTRTFIGAGVGGPSSKASILTAAAVTTYANATDLQDDALAPPRGSYGTFLDATGSYFRINSPPEFTVTCEPVQGANAAARTIGQLAKILMRDYAAFGITNLLLRSEEIDNASWSKTNVTVTQNNVANPINGAVTADKVAAASSAATSISQAVTVPSTAPITFSCYIKKGSGATDANAFKIRNVTTATDLFSGSINLDTGVTSVSAGSGAIHAQELTGLFGAGWYRISLSITSGYSASNSVAAFAAFTGASETNGEFSFIFGAQFEMRATASAYIPTAATTDVGGDWNAQDILDLDTAFSAEAGFFSKDGDRDTVGGKITELLSSGLAFMNTDVEGVIRLKQLKNPDPNLCAQADTLATSPWVATSVTVTNKAATSNGRSYSRVANTSPGSVRQDVTLTGNVKHVLTWAVKYDGQNGQDMMQLFDVTAAAARIEVRYTFNANGTISFNAVTGTVETFDMGGGDYFVRALSTTCVDGNSHRIFASNASGGGFGGGSVASFLTGSFRMYDREADVVIRQGVDTKGLIEVASADANNGLPPYRLQLRFAKSYAVLTEDIIAGDVSDSVRAQVQQEWLTVASTIDSAIVAAHPLSGQRNEESLIIDSTAAANEVTRRVAIFGIVAGRRWFGGPLELNSNTFPLELGATVDIISTRYGMGAGRRGICLGLNPDVAGGVTQVAILT